MFTHNFKMFLTFHNPPVDHTSLKLNSSLEVILSLSYSLSHGDLAVNTE